MDISINLATLCYVLSAAAYMAYFALQKEALSKSGLVLMIAGFVLHGVGIGAAFVSAGAFPVRNLHETLVFAGWACAGTFLACQFTVRLKILGIYAGPFLVLIMGAALFTPKTAAVFDPLLNSFWLVIHVVSIFIGEAGLALACGAGILYLLQENAIKNKRHGIFFRRLPSLDSLDLAGYALIVIGFTFLTIGLASGMIYARTVWGRFWSWDPKEVWSAVTWLIYAALLHERLAVGWRGKRAAVWAIVGFGVVLFTFFGVNLLLQGHHGPFTRW